VRPTPDRIVDRVDANINDEAFAERVLAYAAEVVGS
jgi:uncharacterized protein (UPF0261 family)